MFIVKALRMFRDRSSSMVLAVSNLSEFFLPLIRGIVLARLLLPAEFGLAISINAVASTIELISDLGFGQMALRSGTPKTIGTLHALAVVRGAGLALVIAAAGPLCAWLFNAPGTAWVYSLMGLASLVRSLSHLEPKLRMRVYDYTPEAIVTFGAQIAWTVVAIVTAFVVHDFRAMVIGLLASTVAGAVLTHLLSSQKYSWGWQQETIREAFHYGRPLTFNGVALAIAGLGDRFLTGARIGLDQLAQYTAMATAALTPRSVVIKFAISLFVPQFVNASQNSEKRRLADIWVISLCGIGAIFAFFYIAIGQFVVALAFGKRYYIEQNAIDLMAILACVRYMATIPVAPSIANGQTSFVLLNTTLASSGLVLAALLLIFYPFLQVMILAIIVGEGFGLLFIVNRLSRTIPLTSSVLWSAILIPLTMLAVVSIVLAGIPGIGPVVRYCICVICVVVESALTLFLYRRSGSDLSHLWQIVFPKRRNVSHA